MILNRGVLIGVATLAAFIYGLGAIGPSDPFVLAKARTLAFSTLVMCQLFHVFDCRSETRSIWEIGLFSNPWLVAAVSTSVAALVTSIYWEPMAAVFKTVPLNFSDWVVVIAAAGSGQILVAIKRWLMPS